MQETRGWDDSRGISYSMRSKEDAKDYRYFPEPDLPLVHISEEWISEIKKRQPEFCTEKIKRYQSEFGLPKYDAEVLTGNKTLADFFEKTVQLSNRPKKVSNWLMGETMRLLNENAMQPEDIPFSPEHLAKLIELTEAGVIGTTLAKEVFEVIFAKDVNPEIYIEEHGLKTVEDEKELHLIIEQVVKEYPKSVEDYKSGKKKAIGFLVGQIMKATQGRANPTLAKELLEKQLSQ